MDYCTLVRHQNELLQSKRGKAREHWNSNEPSAQPPCPACNATAVYRRNSAGENVRVPALQIIAEQGCTCLVCHASWTPDRYLLLCRVLGFDLPRGVLGVVPSRNGRCTESVQLTLMGW